jgi:hypothetical protein
MKNNIIAICAAIILFSGCASIPSAQKTAMLRQGMASQEVVAVLGEPHQTELEGNKLIWKYNMYGVNSGLLPYYLIFDNSTNRLERWYVNKEEYERNREYDLRASPPVERKDIDISVRNKDSR